MTDLSNEDRNQLRTMIEETWVNACLRSDWDAATAVCTEDVDYMPADIPWVHGREELKDFLDNFPEIVDFSQTFVKATGDSSRAVVLATFAGSFVAEGQKLSGVGKVLTTAEKRDGEWLFSAVCFNWDSPPAPSD